MKIYDAYENLQKSQTMKTQKQRQLSTYTTILKTNDNLWTSIRINDNQRRPTVVMEIEENTTPNRRVNKNRTKNIIQESTTQITKYQNS